MLSYLLAGLLLLLQREHSVTEGKDIVGVWFTEKQEGTVLIREVNGQFEGTLVGLKEPVYREGGFKRDRRNPDRALRSRPLLGIVVLKGLMYNKSQGRWEQGSVYIPKLGQELSCLITLSDENTLKIKGFISPGGVSYSQTWTRKQ